MGKGEEVDGKNEFNIIITISQQNHLGLACILNVWVYINLQFQGKTDCVKLVKEC